jgi:hypothetical protein
MKMLLSDKSLNTMELATWSIEEIMWLLVEGQKKLNKSFDI